MYLPWSDSFRRQWASAHCTIAHESRFDLDIAKSRSRNKKSPIVCKVESKWDAKKYKSESTASGVRCARPGRVSRTTTSLFLLSLIKNCPRVVTLLVFNTSFSRCFRRRTDMHAPSCSATPQRDKNRPAAPERAYRRPHPGWSSGSSLARSVRYTIHVDGQRLGAT